jgi:hypothetical protein
MAGASDWLTIDMTEIEGLAAQMNAAADQIPFALVKSMNTAANLTRKYIVEHTWPSSVKVRNTQFIAYALRWEPATKATMTVSIYDTLNKSVKLKLHAEGGTKTSPRGRFAIPNLKYVVKGAHGVSPTQAPRNLPNSFVKGDVIYQRIMPSSGFTRARLGALSRGAVSRGLRLMYVLKQAVVDRKDVPFYRDFQTHMHDEIIKAFPHYMEQAMKTRRPR